MRFLERGEGALSRGVGGWFVVVGLDAVEVEEGEEEPGRGTGVGNASQRW